MPTETELKFRIPDELIAQRLISDPRVLSYMREGFSDKPMDARYYDLANGSLSARKWTFRLRKEGERSFAAFKTEPVSESIGGIFYRNEWQCPANTVEEGVKCLIDAGVPSEFSQLIKDTNFVERCRVTFNRRSAILCLPDHVRIEMAIDSGKVEAGNKSEVLLELELELLYGDIGAVLELGEYLSDKYGLHKEMISKYERALRLIRSRR